MIPTTQPYAAFLATLLFYSLFDHPHIFQTFSRTHADPIEFQRHRFLYTFGLLSVIGAGYLIKGFHWEWQFEAFLNIYGIWHILRQNSGFLKLYRRLANESLVLDTYLDFGLLYGGLLLLLAFRVSDAYHMPLEWIPRIPFPADFLHKTFWLLVFVYTLRQFFLLFKGTLQLPKVLFLFAIVGTYYFTYVTSDPPLGLLVAIETIYHDVQYQGWITRFQKRRFGRTSWRKWFASSMAYGVLFAALFLVFIGSHLEQWILAPFYMLVLFHYFIDARIWRFSQSPELKVMYG